MKTIMVIGEPSDSWRKHLVNELNVLLGDTCVQVKIEQNKNCTDDSESTCYQSDISLEMLKEKYGNFTYLIVESNNNIAEITPDLSIYPYFVTFDTQMGDHKETPRLIFGTSISVDQMRNCAEKLEMSLEMFKKISWLSGVRPECVQGVVLAGGKSSRMGSDKAMLQFGVTTLAGSIVNMLNPYCDNLLISIAKGKLAPVEGVRVIEDVASGMGPMMGIYTALQNSYHRVCLITACDIPYVHPLLIRKLLSFTDKYDIVVPSFKEGFVEPMIGVYTKECCDVIKKLLNENRLKVKELFSICKTKIICGFDGTWYANLNTREEYVSYCKSSGILMTK